MDEIEKLKTEIKVLNKRIAILEGKENRRHAFRGIRLLIKIVVILGIIYCIWYGYDYITKSIPKQIEDGVEDLLKVR